VRELEAAIHVYLAAKNDDPKPFVWTKTADQILASIARFAQATLKDHGISHDTSEPRFRSALSRPSNPSRLSAFSSFVVLEIAPLFLRAANADKSRKSLRSSTGGPALERNLG
jgi:hypothetical protein